MSTKPFCFVVMPFRPELHYLYLYLQRYLSERHGLHVERGDHDILTRALMEKIRDKILEADVIIAGITGANPNVLYEIGFAHAAEKPVIFLTQDRPEQAPIDVRGFESICYDIQRHEEFLAKIDIAIYNAFAGRYTELRDAAISLLRRFNEETGAGSPAASPQDFQARVMVGEQADGIPPETEFARQAEFLLPKILGGPADVATMRRVSDWLARLVP